MGRLRELEPARAVLAVFFDYGERRMRAAIHALPDGEYRFDDVLDSTGGPGDARAARICVKVTVLGDTITFDFAGTDAQRAGSVNAVEAVTVSAVVLALRSDGDPDLPANGGVFRPVRVITPSGSIVSARMPVA